MPRALLPVLGVVGLEAAALLVVAGLSVRALVTGDVASAGLSVGVVVVAVGVAVLLLGAGRALAAGRRWGRAPVVTWQLLQLAVAVPALQSDRPLVPVALLVASLVVAVGLFLPAVVRHTTTGSTDPPTL